MRVIGRVVLLALLLASVAEAGKRARLKSGRAFFQKYIALEQAFDPSLIDLYAEEAVIKNMRKYPDGSVKELSLVGGAYKDMVRAAMPLAKARGEKSIYSDIRYVAEGAGIRITATRFSQLKKYASPFSLLIKRRPKKGWLIYEESSSSQP